MVNAEIEFKTFDLALTSYLLIQSIYSAIAIIPRDPGTGAGWKNGSTEYLQDQTGEALQGGLERHAFLYDEIVQG